MINFAERSRLFDAYNVVHENWCEVETCPRRECSIAEMCKVLPNEKRLGQTSTAVGATK